AGSPAALAAGAASSVVLEPQAARRTRDVPSSSVRTSDSRKAMLMRNRSRWVHGGVTVPNPSPPVTLPDVVGNYSRASQNRRELGGFFLFISAVWRGPGAGPRI